MTPTYRLLRLALRPVVHLVFRPHVEGLHHLPPSGPVILAANHLSFADHVFPPVLLRRRVTYLAKVDYFTGRGVRGRLTRMLFEGLGMLPLDRSGADAAQAALEQGLQVLSGGGVLGIYPEGTRSPDGRLYRGKTGVARLALASGAPVVPVAITGTYEVQPQGRLVPRVKHVQVRMGPPLDFSRYAGGDDEHAVLRAVTDEVVTALQVLSGFEYVDAYAADVKAARADEQRLAEEQGRG